MKIIHDAPAEGEQTLISRRAADIAPRHIDFLWPGRLACGKHTAFAGEPGDGKSQLSVYVAATLSRGGEWPCNEGRAPLGNVIIFNAEDGADDTIVPRLIAVGADMERVHIVSAVLLEDGKGRRAFNLQADLALLERKIREIGDVALVIIDPISSYMGKADSHKNSEVRGALEPLSEMAERMRVAVLSITHFSKSGSGTTNKALHRFIGSIAFVGAPRAAFAVIEDADNEGRVLFLHAKNNMARKPQGLAYRLLQTTVGDNIVASYVDWENTPVMISADKALGAAQDTGNRTMREEAVDFLRTVLAQGAVPAEEVQQAARKAGITPKPLRVARDDLKIVPRRKGFGPGAVWNWSLPGPSIDALAPIDAQSPNEASMEPKGVYGGSEAPTCNSAATAVRGHRGQDVTVIGEGSLNPEVCDGDPRDCGPMPGSAARQGNEKQPDAADAVADVLEQAEKAPPPAAEVIDVAEKATREAEQRVSAPDPVLVMQHSKEDAGMPPVPPPAMTYDEEVAEIRRRKLPPGNERRALNEAKNREMTRQFDAKIREQQRPH